ncbi:MAG: nucleotidyltransferase [Oligoflexales bacterium]|nr:nucleotidyltransferase [Oligoflexales bacterium]
MNFEVDERLEEIAELLDIPDAFRKEVELLYAAIASHLGRPQSKVNACNPRIYTQGSFRTGTVVRPFFRKGDVDVDIVCTLRLQKSDTTKKELRALVGNELKSFNYENLTVELCGRCWRLNLGKHLHVDVLPAIDDLESLPTGILLTDREEHRWQYSNPIAYANWFFSKIEAERTLFDDLVKADIEKFPEAELKAKIQIAVQLLKRHRDAHFKNTMDLRPPSIIITTLMGLVDQPSATVFERLTLFSGNFSNKIKYENGKYILKNPVSENENFVDKWNQFPERRDAFLNWQNKLRTDLDSIAKTRSIAVINATFAANEFLDNEGDPVSQKTLVALGAGTVPALSSTAHAETPSWPKANREYKSRVLGSVHFKERGLKVGQVSDRPISKKRSLKFWVESNVPGSYEVYWQVINTGVEAQKENGLRGNIEVEKPSAIRWESTAFLGTHYVVAHLVKEGYLVSTTPMRIVRIK